MIGSVRTGQLFSDREQSMSIFRCMFFSSPVLACDEQKLILNIFKMYFLQLFMP